MSIYDRFVCLFFAGLPSNSNIQSFLFFFAYLSTTWSVFCVTAFEHTKLSVVLFVCLLPVCLFLWSVCLQPVGLAVCLIDLLQILKNSKKICFLPDYLQLVRISVCLLGLLIPKFKAF